MKDIHFVSVTDVINMNLLVFDSIPLTMTLRSICVYIIKDQF